MEVGLQLHQLPQPGKATAILSRRHLLAAIVAAGVLATPASGERAPGTEPTLGPLVSGTTAYVEGTFVWTDYAYDDHGPDRAATYPSPDDQNNAADLVQLQLAATGDRLRVTAVLETLTRPELPLLGVGLDVDGGGAPALPGSWRPAGNLGLDRMLLLSSAGGELRRWTGTQWQREARFSVRVDAARNVITGEVPLALPDTVRAVAALGLARAGSSWLDGSGPVYDLAFVVGEPPVEGNMLVSAQLVAATGQGHATGGEWQDRRQGEVLAGTLAATNAVATIDVAAMRAGATQLPDITKPGYHTWLYRSHVPLPEGIVDGTRAGGLWAGPYQPYLVQVPAQPDGSSVLWLHGGGGNHLSASAFTPGQLSLGRAVVVFPFGRTVTTSYDHGYSGVGERDVLDVLADVQRSYRLDPTRVVVGGISTGGGGASRMGQLHPDRFGGVLVVSAFDDTHLPGNLINTALVLHNGSGDPAANQAVLAATLLEFDTLHTFDYRSFTVEGAGHGDVTAPLTQCVLDRLLARRVPQRPARVIYGLDPANTVPRLDLQHGQAFWLRDARLRADAPASVWQQQTPAGGNTPAYGDNAVGVVDLTTQAVATRTFTAEQVDEFGQNITAGADLCGPADVHTNQSWRMHGTQLEPGEPEPVRNTLTGTLRHVETFTVDLTRAGLDPRRQLTLELRGDGVTTVRLAGPWPGGSLPVLVDGRRVSTARARGGVLELRLDLAGDRVVTVG